MEEMLKALERIGVSETEIQAIREHYDGNIDGLTEYYLYCVAVYDDRHEYV